MPSQRPYLEIRASDSERERVVAFLREHALQGRLDNEELEERIGLAYAAVYVGDLERLIGDLPRSSQPATRHHRPPAPRKRRHEPNPALIVAGVAVLFITGVPFAVLGGLIAVLAIVVALSFVLGPFILIALLIVPASRRGHHHGHHHRHHRHHPPSPPRFRAL